MRLSDSCRMEAGLSRGAFLTMVTACAILFTASAWAQTVQPPSAAPAATQPAGGAASTAPAEGTPIFRCEAESPARLQWVYNFSEVKVGDKIETRDVWSGDPVECAFVVRNDGNAVLRILEVRPTCGCTVAEFDKEIQPGSQGKIIAKLSTAGIYYPVSKAIHVKTNDPKAAQLTLLLKGTVKARVGFRPPEGAQFGHFGPNTPQSITVKLTNNTETPLTLEPGPTPPMSPYTCELKEVEPGKVFEAKISYDKAKLREGANFAQIILKTNIEKQPQVTIPTNLFLPPVIQVQPPTLAVATPVAPNFSRQIVLTRSEGAMQITGVTVNDPAIKVEAQPAPVPATVSPNALQRVPGQVWNLTVKVDEGWDPPVPMTQPVEITVTTDVKEKPEVKIRTHVYPTRPAVNAHTLIGKLAPLEGSLKTQTGQSMPLGGNTGKVTVTSFWTSWCPVCKRMLPMLQRVANLYAKRGVDFNLVSLDRTVPPEKVAEMVKNLGVTLPFSVDAKQLAGRKYGADRFPMTFVMGKDGIIEAVNNGAPDNFEEILKGQLDALLAGKNREAFPKPAATAAQPGHVAAPLPRPAATVSPTPSLVLDSLQQDIGTFKPGAAGTFNLYMRNGGSQELQVKNVATSEGLKLDPSYPRTVSSTRPATLRLDFTAPRQPGPFEHQVTIETNDPNRPTATVKLTGRVRNLIELQPASGVDFGRRPGTFSVERLASLIWNGEGAIKFLSVESNSPRFEGTVKPIQQGPHHMVVVKAKPPFEPGENTGTLFVKTDSKEQPVVEVPVKLYQPPRVDVDPATVNLVKSGRPQHVKVMINNNGTTSLNVLSVKASNPSIRTQFFPQPDGLSYQMQLSFQASFSPSPEGEKVTIRTDDPEYAEIVIPIKSN